MISAQNCEATRVIVGCCACMNTGQYEPCFLKGVEATAKLYWGHYISNQSKNCEIYMTVFDFEKI